MKIISISGLIGSGKDTAAKYLCERHGYAKFAFASVLKDIAAALFGWDRALLQGDTEESRQWRDKVDAEWNEMLNVEVEVTPRWALQYLGTEVFRNNLDPDIWLFCLKRRLDLAAGKGLDKVVITDARFLNEMAFLRSRIVSGDKVAILGIVRALPKAKLNKFYNEVERRSLREVGCGFQELDMASVRDRCLLAGFARAANESLKDPWHQSEYEHLVWPKYDTLLDNNRTKSKLYEQLESVIASNEQS